MSSYVYMKVLESAPHRYDRGIRMLSRGGIDKVYERIAERVARAGKVVLDVGCGTGSLALMCAYRGARVFGIDINAGMLDVARSKPLADGSTGSVEWLQLGALEIEDRFDANSLDAAVSTLAFSELAPDEQGYVLETLYSRLKPGGLLAIADEVLPRRRGRRLGHRLRRWPVAALTFLLTQTTTRPVEDLAPRIESAGFADVREERVRPGDLVIVSGRKPEDPTCA